MRAGVKKSLPGGDSADGPGPRDWNGFLIVCGLFLIYESVLIVVFGDYFYNGVSSELGRWGMIALAALGYVLLGAMAGPPASFFATLLPILVAWILDPTIPSEAWGGENLPLYQVWIVSSFVYVPAWVLGFLTSLLNDARRRGQTRIR